MKEILAGFQLDMESLEQAVGTKKSDKQIPALKGQGTCASTGRGILEAPASPPCQQRGQEPLRCECTAQHVGNSQGTVRDEAFSKTPGRQEDWQE